ncbi:MULTISPECIES: MFS transporter [unclassified Bradyrhizobium]|uniref:MFS transporter n=1 Tax=unclassified Bradyrhizobium TaxID=2631580 RepID=UPI002FF09FA6
MTTAMNHAYRDSSLASWAPPDDEIETILRKVDRRLIFFLFIVFVVGFIDRINIGFAALTMNRDLGLTASQFGMANSLFYIGYVAFELPSNLALAKYGARIWIPRIMVTWGIAACLTCLAVGPHSLYALRFIVGIAEAGLMPGVLLYLTYWVPAHRRARATALFLVGQPFTIATGSLISGLILQLDGTAGLKGWQWLFIIEGAPSVILGVTAWFVLSDRPSKASWLTQREAEVLERAISDEEGGSRTGGDKSTRAVVQALWRPVIATLALIYFCLVTSLNAISTWLPQIVKDVSSGWTPTAATLLASIPAVCACFVMLWLSRMSDRAGTRRMYTVLPMLFAALGWLMAGFGSDPIFRFLGLILTTAGAYGALGVFWAIPASHLSAAAKPAGLALITMAGIMGSIVSPYVIGVLRDLTGNFAAGLLFAAVLLILGATLIAVTPFANAAVRRHQQEG